MKYLIVILLFIISIANAINVKDCGSKVGSFSSVEITGCETSTVCILKRNSNVTINIDFTTSKDVSSIKAIVHGVIEGLPVPYPIPNDNACINSNVTCPVTKDTLQHYTATFAVRKNYPKINVKVKWELQNENGEDIICMEIPTKIQ